MRKKLCLNSHPTGARGKKQVSRTYSKFYHKSPGLTSPHELFLGQKSNDSSQSKYKQIVDIFRYSGGYSEAETYLTYWGVSPIIKDLLLSYAEYDALSGGCDA